MSDALIPQTTPFVQPSVCADFFTTTTFTAAPYGNKQQQAKVHALVPNQADSRFSSCYPGGPGRSDQYSFSPAVCPSGWTASYLGRDQHRRQEHSTYTTTAYCCPSGYSLEWQFYDTSIGTFTSLACFQGSWQPSTTTATSSASGHAGVDTTSSTAQADVTPLASLDRNDDYRIQQPWHIAWMPSDTSSLSPAPPEWTCTPELPSWVPGTAVSKGCPDDSPHDDDYLAGLGTFYGLVIGLPIGIGLLILLFCVGCWRFNHGPPSRKKAQSISRNADVSLTAYGGDPTSQTTVVPAPAYRRSSETTDVPPAYMA
ncbi:hypothetical protein GE09DRAFT_223619 [Coniochaeta sp. 2T2.1]|nr:hypothetical protein GE09DRAFT_223619 [Coniochaeta sp. 2T2.1]